MRKKIMSQSIALDRMAARNGWTTKQAVKHTLSEVLRYLALSLELEVARGDSEIPKGITVEVVVELLDMHIVLHLEEATDAIPAELPQEDS